MAIPVILYFPRDPLACIWLLQVSGYSMISLLRRDEIMFAALPYGILFTFIYRAIVRLTTPEEVLITVAQYDFLAFKSLSKMPRPVILFGNYFATDGLLHFLFVQAVCPLPKQYPYLFDLLNACFCCAHFLMFLVYFTVCQIYGHKDYERGPSDFALIFDPSPEKPMRKPSSKRAKILARRQQ